MLKKLSFPLLLVSCCCVFGAVQSIAVRPSQVWADDDDDDDDDAVHELMEKTHEGKKSPWRKVNRAVNADPLNWADVDDAMPRFEKMIAALAKAKDADVRDSADGYTDAVKDLLASSKKRDAPGARKALKALSQSCGDCHYKGGPGGKLDD
ncbi:MAG: hypothetical protein KDA41_15365 [Planctomycetales bacterium]|nr:hypothetical protein [Planctomycetales bacterium]